MTSWYSCNPKLPRRRAAIALSTLFSAVLSLTFGATAQAQWSLQNPGTEASFRGMSVVDSNIVWISGTKATFAWTTDGGRSWHPGTVAAAGSFDFRAVHAFALDTALLMVSAQDTALIYRTTDRGATWVLQYRDMSKGAFLDGMAFFDSRHGLAVGDPMNGRFVILETKDGGQHWSRIPDAGLPPALPGEGAFAASGTSLVTCGPRDAWLGTGGAAQSRVFHSSDAGRSWSVVETPISAGVPAAGIFSLACRDTRHLIAVGGNYSRPDASAVTVATSDDGGRTWIATAPQPSTGFLSGVAFIGPRNTGDRLVAVGTEGTSFSTDSGVTWSRLDSLSLNVVMSGADGAAWAAGARGKVAILDGLHTGVKVGKRLP
jgi:photosystem II stability/assembly factor-like uncharacterized protein